MRRLWLSGKGQLPAGELALARKASLCDRQGHKPSPGTPGGCPAAIARIGGSEAHLFSSVSLPSLIVMEPLAISRAPRMADGITDGGSASVKVRRGGWKVSE